MTYFPFVYIPNFVTKPDEMFVALRDELNWERRENTPRSEYYSNDTPLPYQYGRGRGVREYHPQPWHETMLEYRARFKVAMGHDLDVCFLNRYHDQSDHLGWHADDSPEMDDERHILIISLGAEREIWFRPNTDHKDIWKLKLEHGSACVMLAGMQDTHMHRIPKAGFLCGERISLTYRGYVKEQ